MGIGWQATGWYDNEFVLVVCPRSGSSVDVDSDHLLSAGKVEVECVGAGCAGGKECPAGGAGELLGIRVEVEVEVQGEEVLRLSRKEGYGQVEKRA